MIRAIKKIIQRHRLTKYHNNEIDCCRFAPPLHNFDYHYPQYKIKLSQHEIELLQVCINGRFDLVELFDLANKKNNRTTIQ